MHFYVEHAGARNKSLKNKLFLIDVLENNLYLWRNFNFVQ